MLYALLNNNCVVELFNIEHLNEDEIKKNIFPIIKQTFGEGNLLKINENQGLILKNYIYDFEKQKFFPPKPFESWVWSELFNNWVCPKPYPEINNISKDIFIWDENIKNWVKQ